MKKFLIICVFCFMFEGFVFAQTNPPPPSVVVVADFTTRAKDVSADEAISVTEMFISALANHRSILNYIHAQNDIISVVQRSILQRQLTTINFKPDDWSDSAKTTQLGTALNADFLVTGAFTQLGDIITLTVTVYNIRTLELIASQSRQYAAENIWNRLLIVNRSENTSHLNIIYGYTTGNTWRDSIYFRIAGSINRLRHERAAEEQRQFAARQSMVGVWESGQRLQPVRNVSSGTGQTDFQEQYFRLEFKADGTFTAFVQHRNYGRTVNTLTNVDVNFGRQEEINFNGTYTRDGNNIRLTFNRSSSWVRIERNNRDRAGREQRSEGSSPSTSGNTSGTVSFGRDSDGNVTSLGIQGTSVLSGSFRRSQ
jgi:hypothetical protein